MPSYFFLLPRYENALEHVKNLSGNNLVQATAIITQPQTARGFIVSDAEVSTCHEFRHLVGLDHNPGPIDALPTNYPDVLFFVEPVRRRRPQVQATGRVAYDAQNMEHMLAVFKRCAEQFGVDIRAYSPNESCFQGDDCYYHRPEEYDARLRALTFPILVNFHCNGGNPNRKRRNLDRLYERRLSRFGPEGRVRSTYFAPLHEDSAIRDTNGTAVAEIVDGKIYILVNLEASISSHFSGERTFKHASSVLERILADAIPVVLEERERVLNPQPEVDEAEARRNQYIRDIDTVIEEYLSHNTTSIERAKRALQTKRKTLLDDSSRLLTGFARNQKALVEAQTELTILESTGESSLRERLRREIQNVLNLPDVVGINYTDGQNGLDVYTGPITIRHQGQTYHMGEFVIHIRDDVRINNLTHAINGFDHPHITGGNCCFGNISERVATLLSEEKIEELVVLLIQFLQTFNAEDPWCRIDRWPTA